jgi:hypothetical protein
MGPIQIRFANLDSGEFAFGKFSTSVPLGIGCGGDYTKGGFS